MKLSAYISIFTLSVVLVSCYMERNQYGYPSSVAFSIDGGEKVITGDYGIWEHTLFIEGPDNDKPYTDELDGDTMVVKYDWLTVKYVPKECKMKMVAEPSPEGLKRQMTVFQYRGNEYTETKVVQF